jgi:hypothetical protein
MRDRKKTMKDIQNFINGAYVSTGRSFDKHSPLTGQVIARCMRPAAAKSMPPWLQRALR